MLRAIPRLFSPLLQQNAVSRLVPSMGYKSQYSIDKLYPNSNPDFLRSPYATSHKPPASDTDEFNGYIPIDELDIKYSRSGGPGGQHVNKVNSKVEIRVNIESAEWIPSRAKAKLTDRERNRITKDGFLIVTSEKTRKQILNQADCLDKLRSMVRAASKKEYEPSQEEIEIMNQRKARSKNLILREKRGQSMKKQLRSM